LSHDSIVLVHILYLSLGVAVRKDSDCEYGC
jgi:hypothetical protein